MPISQDIRSGAPQVLKVIGQDMLSRAPLVIMIEFRVVLFAPDEYWTVFVGCFCAEPGESSDDSVGCILGETFFVLIRI